MNKRKRVNLFCRVRGFLHPGLASRQQLHNWRQYWSSKRGRNDRIRLANVSADLAHLAA